MKKPPESYLKAAEAEEREQHLGHLKIYLGAAPGVGKTYQMLSDALVKRAQGVDVVIGVIETHGRQDIESLASAFEKLPLKMIEKNAHVYKTLDMDAVRARSPSLVLIDEAAFSNPEDALHPKRWQDIEDLIQQGFDVYTTLNVQHLESLNDIVGALIGVPIYETVPDSFLEQASRIELIDLPSEELIARLKEGKVYLPKQAELAVHHFFKKNNLDALRELALKIAAERVSQELDLDTGKAVSSRLLYQEDKLLVCITSDADMVQLIRAGKRLASRLNCQWMVLHVDTAEEKNFQGLKKLLDFATSLGASTHVLMGTQVLTVIENFIEQQEITQLVIGKSTQYFWRRDRIFKQLSKDLLDIGIYSIHVSRPKKPFLKPISLQSVSVVMVLACIAALMAYVKNIFSPWDFGWLTGLFILSMAYFGAWRWVLILMFFFLGIDLLYNERSLDLLLYEPWSWLAHYGSWSLLFLSLSAYLIHARRELFFARRLATDHQILLSFYQITSNLRTEQELIDKSCSFLEKQFKTQVSLYVFKQNKLKQVYPKQKALNIDDKESGVLQWVFESGQVAGPGTGNFIYAPGYYLSLQAASKNIGVIKLVGFDASETQKKVFMGCCQQLTSLLALESSLRQVNQEKEKHIKKSVRHDILKQITQYLYQPFLSLSDEMKDAHKSQEWQILMHLKSHLKVLNYFSDEHIVLNKSLQNIQHVLLSCLQRYKDKWQEQDIRWHIEAHLPELMMQPDLIIVVIESILDNVLKHADPKQGLDISIYTDAHNLIVELADYGPGINEEEMHKLFESFYRGSRAKARGLGLGLAICERIMAWHSGRIWVENRPNKQGAIFYFSIPLN